MARAQKWLPVVPAGRERGRRRHAEDLGPVAHQPAVEVAEPQVVADRQAQSSQRGRDDDRAIARRDALRLAVADRLGDVDVEEVDLAVGAQDRAVGPEQNAGVVAAGRLVAALVERAEQQVNAQAAGQLGEARQVGPSSDSAVRTFSAGGPRKLVFSGVATSRAP